MKSTPRLFPACLSVWFLVACAVPAPGEDAPTPQLTTQDFADGNDGYHSQGTLLHGTPYLAAYFANTTVLFEGRHRGATSRLDRGELVADMTLLVNGTTASLQACTSSGAQGATRACGLVVEGQGTCTPGTRVTMTSGGICHRDIPGSCSGEPVVRVCSGERPCEHEGTGYLATGAPTCGFSACPSVLFTCPASGIYTVLAGASTPGNAWSLDLASTSGVFPATTRELRAEKLVGARFQMNPGSSTGPQLELAEVTNASEVVITESPGTWDPSGATFLYNVKVLDSDGQVMGPLCGSNPTPGAGPGLAVPVRGLYDTLGNRTESTAAFTLGCDYAVIAKCYRWGYKPWLDGAQAGPTTKAHWSCTRMARADYCGNGSSYTRDGTPIRLWDGLSPTINPPPANPIPPVGVKFEAGWKTTGPACLSHWRWRSLDATCIDLNWPIYDEHGKVLNDCRDSQDDTCAAICDDANEAAQLYGANVFNESAIH
ncbi:ADYC domain-containing protein [Corallococcus llansteffanensis]|uniref:ADYC domain-containing protein n=1 Tax=Corallococcus llansteffanensis TaxID=2316731 RepID=UPI001FC9619B|nr:ADYC domain-containing protein [Corallococcus llansteffanensis]